MCTWYGRYGSDRSGSSFLCETRNQPFATGNTALKLRYDLLGYWHAVRNGEPQSLRQAPVLVEIDRMSHRYDDFQTWCREIVWWGNKKGAYLYSPTAREITPELAGHY